VALLAPSTWSLRRTLLTSVIGLFVVVSLVIGVFTAAATRTYLVGRTDAELRAVAERIERGGEPLTTDGGPGRRRDGPAGGASTLLTAVVDGSTVESSRAVTLTNQPTGLTTGQVGALLSAGLSNRPTEVDLGPRLGTYRLIAAASPDGRTVIAGLRTGAVDATVRAVARLFALGALIGTALVAVVGSLLIRRHLAPLERVAGTAAQVSRLKLDSGDVALAARVRAQDANPATEVGAVGLALNNMLDNVESALRTRQESETRIRRFVADASHELRTPLASIRGYAELTRRGEQPVPPSVSHALGRVESEAVRMQALVEDLLLLARLDSGRPLARETVDLTALVLDAVSDAHAAAPGHEWGLDLPDEAVEVIGDEPRLHQVVGNLLANARTHTPPGTTVTTRLRQDGQGVLITVADDGPGIPGELQGTVFERFTRADDSRGRAAGSTGLGLSIVAAVAEAHGGRVEVESRPGRTVFTVRLPWQPPTPEGAQTA
jgi:two-component system, OmpR family, sensor kinase